MFWLLAQKEKIVVVTSLLMVVLPLPGCNSVSKYLQKERTAFGEAGDNPVFVSAIELIASGEKYDGWRVSVMGPYAYEFEASLLFYNRESYFVNSHTNSIFIDIDDNLEALGFDSREHLEDLSRRYDYANIVGTFYYAPRKQLKVYENEKGETVLENLLPFPQPSGGIYNIEFVRFFDIPRPEDWEKQD